ncbi:ATP-binding protein [Actinokineospora iranica]
MPPRTAHLAAVRTHIKTWLTGLAVADTTAHDIVTATDEALTNAVNHNHDTLTGLVALTIEATPTAITTTITSNGTWTSSTPKEPRISPIGTSTPCQTTPSARRTPEPARDRKLSTGAAAPLPRADLRR